MRKYANLFPILIVAVMLGCGGPTATKTGQASLAATPGKLSATVHDSHFYLSHEQYNGVSLASDGNIYYALSTSSLDTGVQMFRFDPATGKSKHLGDLTEAVGEKGMKAIPQGKVHTLFWEAGGKLYFTTHLGYYKTSTGKEEAGTPPPGYKPYPGGHFLSYDMTTGKFENLGRAPGGQGIIDMALDAKRGRLYGLTWPRGDFLQLDLATRKLKNLGPVSHGGEAGTGKEFRTLCRTLVVDPDDGSVYFTTADGNILRYVYSRDAIEKVKGVDLVKDYFGCYDPTKPGTMGYNWRQAFWYAPEKAIYATHGNSGYLFRFKPSVPQVDVLERITSLPSKRSGMYDMFYYGYLGFTLGPDGRTIYYLTGGPITVNGKLVIARKGKKIIGAQGVEDLHLVTYDIPTGKYLDHGAIYYDGDKRPSWVNSIAVGRDGSVYFVGKVERGGKDYMELLSVSGSQIRK